MQSQHSLSTTPVINTCSEIVLQPDSDYSISDVLNKNNADFSASQILKSIAEKVVRKVFNELVLESIPNGNWRPLYHHYVELESIFSENITFQRKLNEATGCLERVLNDKNIYDGPLKSSVPLLHKACDWLKEISELWMRMADIYNHAQSDHSVSQHIVTALELTETLLENPFISKMPIKDPLTSLSSTLAMIKQVTAQMKMLNRLPGDPRLADYLALFRQFPLAQQYLHPSVLHLADIICEKGYAEPFPGKGSLQEQLTWFACAIANRDVVSAILPHIEMLLGSTANANRWLALFTLAEQIKALPMGDNPGETISLIIRAIGENKELLPGGHHYTDAMKVSSESLKWIVKLFSLYSGSTSASNLIREATSVAAPNVAKWAANQATQYFLPAPVASVLSNTLFTDTRVPVSWGGMFKKIVSEAYNVLKPYAAGLLMEDPFAADTIRYAEALQKIDSFDGLLQWFASCNESRLSTLNEAHTHYLIIMLVWKIHQELQHSNIEEAEASLRRLSAQLKDYGIIRKYPLLQNLADLIPLMPALKAALYQVDSVPEADTWIEWGNQWLNKLAGIDSPEIVRLRHKMSDNIANWVSDALMNVIDEVAASSILPLSDAAFLPEWQGFSVPKHKEIAQIKGPLPAKTSELAMGIGFELMGAASILCAVYNIFTGRRSTRGVRESVEEKNAQIRLLTSNRRTYFSSLPKVDSHSQVLVFLGFAGILAGSGLIFDYIKSVSHASEDILSGDEEEKIKFRIAEIEDSLSVPDLSVIFGYSTQAEHDGSKKIKPVRLEAYTMQEMKGPDSLRSDISKAFAEIEMNAKGRQTFERLFKRAQTAIEVEEAPEDEKDVRLLIKTIEIMVLFRDAIGQIPDLKKYLNNTKMVLVALNKIADNLPTGRGAILISKFRESFHINADDLKFRALPKSSDGRRAKALLADYVESGDIDFGLPSESILDLHGFLINRINEDIKKYIESHAVDSGFPADLNANSMIKITLSPVVLSTGNTQGVKAPKQVTINVSIFNIVTGQYHDTVRSMRDPSGRAYSVYSMKCRELINYIKRDNLQGLMKSSLRKFKDDTAKQSELERFYHRMIIWWCVKIISEYDGIPLYRRCIKEFLEGKIKACTVKFHDAEMNGVIYIPADDKGSGILIDVDDGRFFLVGSQEYTCKTNHKEYTVNLSTTPDTELFRQWVLGKIPGYTSAKYVMDGKSFTNYLVEDALFFSSYSDYRQPYTFTPVNGPEELAKILKNTLLNRLDADIDYLIVTDAEHNLDMGLQALKNILLFFSLALTVVAPGPGTLVGRFIQYVGMLYIDAAYVGATALQAYLADKPDRAHAYTREAILSGLFCLPGVLGGANIIRKTSFSIAEIQQMIAAQRQFKSAYSAGVGKLLSVLSWRRLGLEDRINFLLGKPTANYRKLATMTHPDFLKKEIKKSLTNSPEALSTGVKGAVSVVNREINYSMRLLERFNTGYKIMLDKTKNAITTTHIEKPLKEAVKWVCGKNSAGKINKVELQKFMTNELSTTPASDMMTSGYLFNLAQRFLVKSPRNMLFDRAANADDTLSAGFINQLDNIKLSSNLLPSKAVELYSLMRTYGIFPGENAAMSRLAYSMLMLKNNPAKFVSINNLPRPKPMGAGLIKPKLKNFSDEKSFKKAMDEYIKKKGTIGRMDAIAEVGADFERRTQIANAKLIAQTSANPEVFGKIASKEMAPFMLTTAGDSKAKTLLLSAHGWYTSDSRSVIVPAGKKIAFLGPHNQILLEAPESSRFLPTEKLIAGDQIPAIFETKSNVPPIPKTGLNRVTNYSLKHYEVPVAEIKLGVGNNRLNGKVMTDVLEVHKDAPGATLNDVFKLMQRGNVLSEYDEVIFYACRECKKSGTLESFKTGLGEGYEIKFSSPEVGKSAAMRLNRADNQSLDFDGLRVYSCYIFKKRDGLIMDTREEIIGVLPYVLVSI